MSLADVGRHAATVLTENILVDEKGAGPACDKGVAELDII